jgi:hypothetical protein
MPLKTTGQGASRRWINLRRGVQLLFIVGGIVAWYWIRSNPCGLPLHYAIGAIDPRFGIDRTEAITRAKNAQAMWEKRVGKKLLVYDESSNFKIDFIFDERQQAILDERALDQRRANVEGIDQQMQASANDVATRYQALKSLYESLLADFESKDAQHTAAVEYWNQQGGAPPRVFDALEQEAADLRLEGDHLDSLRQQANEVADEENAILRTEKSVIDTYNNSVTSFNKQRRNHPDEQGVYIMDGNKRPVAIQIYEFLDPPELSRSLAHEFGHALRVEHENDPTSIMKQEFESDDRALGITDASIATLKAACNP